MSAPQKVLDLIDVYDRNADDYHAAGFKEAELRQQFINPFFKCLGWDMDNEQGYAEAYKEVVNEASVKVAGATKAPDYCFRIGGTPKFFLEAKKPAVNVKDDPAPAFQLRRYGWSAKLPLSLLTNFEGFAVYDGRVKPAQSDKAATARVLYLHYADYAKEWDKIAGVFSRDAILKGSFDKFADVKKGKRGTATVDTAFLEEIESWREELAKNLAVRNPELSSRDLNFAVQITIDRIIFLRMCEDRGIEPYGQLKSLLVDSDIYGQLRDLYRKADDRYNSGLFHFHKERERVEAHDELTPRLTIDDKVLKAIVKGLYYPDSPYEFSVLPVEILGQVYEQFLGKVIRLTAGHQARVEEKPEVKKAGGVYYTPAYIVEYIVKQTVGRLLEGKTPKQAAKLRILDPACGSGSFLLGAYQYLLTWHLEQYQAAGPEKHKKELFQASADTWRLTTGERKRILLNNIYGVDIDPQAVEVTKLSLLLKVLEGESQQTIDTQRKLFHERALPDLASNIKCGNSLIGPDFYENQQMLMFDEEERYRINVFDWNAAFPQIMKAGGFDAVIGNPPYVDVKLLGELMKRELAKRYSAATRRFDLYVPFVQKGLELLSTGGVLGFIIPSMFIRREYGRDLRKAILSTSVVEHIVDFGSNQVFQGPMNYVGVFILSRTRQQAHVPCLVFQRAGLSQSEIEQALCRNEVPGTKHILADATVFAGDGEWYLNDVAEKQLIHRLLTDNTQLRDLLAYASEGIHSGKDEVFYLANETAVKLRLETPPVHPLVKGKNVHRYDYVDLNKLTHKVIYPYDLVSGQVIFEEELERNAPCTLGYLRESRNLLKGRPYFDKSKKKWYELWCPRTPELFISAKIVGPEIACRGEFTLLSEPLFFNNKIKGIIPTSDFSEGLKYLLGLLNSSLLVFLHRTIAPPKGGNFFEVKTAILGRLPIRRINFGHPTDRARHKKMNDLVDQMLVLRQQLAGANIPDARTRLQRGIDVTDRQIDKLVYELYALTQDEIQIVEASTETVPTETPDDAAESQNWDQINARRIELAEKGAEKDLTPAEAAEFDRLQTIFFQYLETKHPSPPLDTDRLHRIEARLNASEEMDGDR